MSPFESVVIGGIALANIALPVATIVLLVVIYRKLSDIQAELRRLGRDGRQ